MATSKPSGLARFTRQGAAPPGAAPKSAEEAGSPPAHPAGASGPTAPGAQVARGTGKAKLVGVYLMPDGHRQLKIEAARRGVTISDLAREALNAWFTNEQLPPLA